MQIYVNFECVSQCCFLENNQHYLSHIVTKPTKWRVRPGKTQSSLSTQRKLGSLVTLSVQIERRLWSDWANAKADQNLRWAHVFCWFCHNVSHFNTQICKYTNTFLENGIGSLTVLSLNRRVIPISLNVLSKEPIHYYTCKNSCYPSLSKALSASIYRQ